MHHILAASIIVISMRGLFIPFDLILFRDNISHSIILFCVVLLLLLYNQKVKINVLPYIFIVFLVIHLFIHKYLLYTNIRYILYVFILLLVFSSKLNFSKVFQLLTAFYSLYLLFALVFHFITISIGEHFKWNINELRIFESNNDAFHRSEWGEIFYSPYLFLLIGEWSYNINNYNFVRFMGFSTEPSILCMTLLPLFFMSLHFSSSISRVYLVCTFIIGISIILSFSVYCIICLTASFFIFYCIFKLTTRMLLLFLLLFPLIYLFIQPFSLLLGSIITQKSNEIIYYTQNLNIFGRSSLSFFGIDTSHYVNESIRSYGAFSIIEKYGLIGFSFWIIISSVFLFYAFQLSKYTKYKYYSCLLISISLYSLKSPHLINFYFILFLLQSILYLNSHRIKWSISKTNLKRFSISPLLQ